MRKVDSQLPYNEYLNNGSFCMGMCREGFRPSESFLSRSELLDHADGASTGFMVASYGCLSEGYGPGVCLGNGQTWAEGVPSQGGRGDALFRRISPDLGCSL